MWKFNTGFSDKVLWTTAINFRWRNAEAWPLAKAGWEVPGESHIVLPLCNKEEEKSQDTEEKQEDPALVFSRDYLG